MDTPEVGCFTGLQNDASVSTAFVAKRWSVSRPTVINVFRKEPGVLRFEFESRSIYRIPWSVLLRVEDRLRVKVPGERMTA